MVKVAGQHAFPNFENEWKVISRRKDINCLPLWLFSSEERRNRTWDVQGSQSPITNWFTYRGSSKFFNSNARSYSLKLCWHCVPSSSLHVLGICGFFFIKTSLLSWHKMVYMRDLTCTFICIKFAYMLSMYLKYVVYGHFNFNLEWY